MEILAQAQENAGEGSERAARAQGERRRAPESAGERRRAQGERRRAQESARERRTAQENAAGERSRRAQQQSAAGERRRAQKRAYTKKMVLEPPKSETFTGIRKFYDSQSLHSHSFVRNCQQIHAVQHA